MGKLFYIFLDIDGVLNNYTYYYKCFEKHHVKGIMSCNCFPFDPNCLNNLMILNQYLTQNNYLVRIILSSTWRMDKTDTAIVNSRLAEYGMRIHDKTVFNGDRTKEIQEYVKRKFCQYYLVLDDCKCDIESNHFVNTNMNTGFDDEKLREALKKVGIK